MTQSAKDGELEHHSNMKKLLILILITLFNQGVFSQAYNNIYASGIYLYADPPSNNNYILLQSPVLGSSITFTLPPTLGTNNYA